MDMMNIVSSFLTIQAGQFAMALRDPKQEDLDKAAALYKAHGGRLPSPPPTSRLVPSERLQCYIRDFSKSMVVFLRKSHDAEASQAYSCSSWELLRTEADEAMKALETHKKRRRDWRHPFEALDNAGGYIARRVEFLFQLVPEGEYASILKGGLRLIYNTAKRKKEVREKILETLEGLGDTISYSKTEITFYSQDSQLREKAEELIMAILDFTRCCVVWLDKSSAIESFKAFFQQTRYGTEIDSVAQKIQTKSESFGKCAHICLQRRIQDIDRNVKWLKEPLIAFYALLYGFGKDIQAQLEELKLKAQTVNPTMNFIQPPAQPTISSQYLRQLLSLDPRPGRNHATVDVSPTFRANVQTALRSVPTSLGQEQIGLLLQGNNFTTWLKSLGSQFLVVHDETALQGNNSLSTLSYLCALMSETLRNPGVIPLTFFCGLHLTGDDTLIGAKGMIRSILLQLLIAVGDVSISAPLDPTMIVQGIMMDNLETLLSIVSMVLGCVNFGIVYCFIDGAYWFGGEARSEEMKAALSHLHQLVAQVGAVGGGLVLKVLVTNPTPRQRRSWDLDAMDIHLEQRLLTGGHRSDIAAMRNTIDPRSPGF